jgi:hypothetical protein
LVTSISLTRYVRISDPITILIRFAIGFAIEFRVALLIPIRGRRVNSISKSVLFRNVNAISVSVPIPVETAIDVSIEYPTAVQRPVSINLLIAMDWVANLIPAAISILPECRARSCHKKDGCNSANQELFRFHQDVLYRLCTHYGPEEKKRGRSFDRPLRREAE